MPTEKAGPGRRVALGITKSAVQRRLEAYRERFPGFEVVGNTRVIPDMSFEDVTEACRKEPMALAAIADAIGRTEVHTLKLLQEAQERGINWHEHGGKWSVQKTPPLRAAGGDARHELFSDEDNHFRFGFVTDNHIGSKYSRLDVLHELYDRFECAGITEVYNAGNYIDGEARFNTFDLDIHGMDLQLRFLAQNYPRREGITTASSPATITKAGMGSATA